MRTKTGQITSVSAKIDGYNGSVGQVNFNGVKVWPYRDMVYAVEDNSGIVLDALNASDYLIDMRIVFSARPSYAGLFVHRLSFANNDRNITIYDSNIRWDYQGSSVTIPYVAGEVHFREAISGSNIVLFVNGALKGTFAIKPYSTAYKASLFCYSNNGTTLRLADPNARMLYCRLLDVNNPNSALYDFRPLKGDSSLYGEPLGVDTMVDIVNNRIYTPSNTMTYLIE